MPTHKSTTSFRTKAFEKILINSLAVNKDNKDSHKSLTVIYDDDFLNMFDALLSVITSWTIPATFIFIPKSYQSMLMHTKLFLDANDEVDLPPQILGALQNSNLILNFLNGDSKFSKIRGAIISLQKKFYSKMVHAPGISDTVLRIVNKSAFKKIHKNSEMVAWALGNAFQCKIISADKSGKEYSLTFNIDGWDNEPFMSSGKIFDNSWGNIPPGESFCCPDLLSVNGQICINGSLPGYLLTPQEEVILTFEKGKMTKWDSNGGKPAKYFANKVTDAVAYNDDNWNSFAEFGVGLNPAIKSLVGNALFDEKMAGTIHIAIGDNTSFGHGIHSFYHDDLICMKPTVILNNDVVIMQNGHLVLERIRSWRRSLSFEELKLKERDLIVYHPKRVQSDANVLHRILSKGDRQGKVGILNGKFKSVYNKFNNSFRDRNEIRYADLKKRFKLNEHVQLGKLLSCFHHYKVINLRRHEN